MPVIFPDEPVGMWRFEDETGKFGLRLNRDESCQALVAPVGGRADIFYCSFVLRGAEIAVRWKPRSDQLESHLPTVFVHFSDEDTVSVVGVAGKPMRRVNTVSEFFAL
jgi:hypothetical protein